MTNTISRIIAPVLKWGTVIVTTAVVVVSIQVFAEGKNTPSGKATALSVAENPKVFPQDTNNWSPVNGFADLIERVSPAVVHVAISGKVRSRQQVQDFNFPPGSPFEDFFEQFRNQQQPREQERERSRPLGIGSGFIISADGYVVTNNHVIKDADEIVVTLTDGEEYQAELIGADVKTDLALLKLEKAKDLSYVAFGDDDKSRVGDWVLAIGNPFGLGGSASTGIISARGRDIRSGPYDDYIQVDAAINRGNSGGPLFNLRGEVIGINTAIYSPNGGSVGIGFSIPASLAENVITQLRESGEVQRAWIGVEIQPLGSDLAEGFGRDDDGGALVANVTPDNPAAKAGIQAGDIILSFAGQDIDEVRDLPRIVASSEVGKKYPVKVWRNGSIKSLTIETERFPDDTVAAENGGKSDKKETTAEKNILGAEMSVLSDELRTRYKLSSDLQGVLVTNVNRDGLAARNLIRPGDVLNSVDNVIVSKPAHVIEQLNKAKKAKRNKVVVLLQRDNNSRFIPFDLSDD